MPTELLPPSCGRVPPHGVTGRVPELTLETPQLARQPHCPGLGRLTKTHVPREGARGLQGYPSDTAPSPVHPQRHCPPYFFSG